MLNVFQMPLIIYILKKITHNCINIIAVYRLLKIIRTE